eukprot:TRINITY_DN28570_c1_g3_i1.p1 TRINITY_DN28570_c1_g3~~TRINITY_DN28570_c1_g3_i1.p1  ORF type:complete len:576 (-),score=70.40 TRINITY_DN28570_c1_g3_i1:34-1761(-)
MRLIISVFLSAYSTTHGERLINDIGAKVALPARRENQKQAFDGATIKDRWPMIKQWGKSHGRDATEISDKGFENSGNACYLISALQVILHSPTLLDFVIGASSAFGHVSSQTETNRMATLMLDVKTIYEQVKAPLPTTIISSIQRRLIDLGMQVDLAGSQEDAGAAFSKILDTAAGNRTPPGFARQQFSSVAEDCLGSRSPNSWVHPIGGGYSEDYNTWQDLGDGRCGTKKLGTPTVITLNLAEAAGDSETVELSQLLSSRESVGGEVSAEDLKDLYTNPTHWKRCNRMLQAVGPREQPFDPDRPLNERYCRDGKKSVSLTVERVAVGEENLAVYSYTKESTWAIPDDDVLPVQLQRWEYSMYGDLVRVKKQLYIPDDGRVEFFVQRDGRVRRQVYELSAFTVKEGPAGGGHWFTIARLNDGVWYEFNDASAGPYRRSMKAPSYAGKQAEFLLFKKVIHGKKSAASKSAAAPAAAAVPVEVPRPVRTKPPAPKAPAAPAIDGLPETPYVDEAPPALEEGATEAAPGEPTASSETKRMSQVQHESSNTDKPKDNRGGGRKRKRRQRRRSQAPDVAN